MVGLVLYAERMSETEVDKGRAGMMSRWSMFASVLVRLLHNTTLLVLTNAQICILSAEHPQVQNPRK